MALLRASTPVYLQPDDMPRGLPEIRTGLAVAGNVGSEQRMQYTAIGDTVNVAVERNGFEYLSEVELKGRQQKLNIYSVPWDEL